MCFHSKLSKTAQELKNRFKAKFENEAEFNPSVFNGFQYPKTPVITNNKVSEIQLFNWGLIPFWAKDDSIKKNTLNARIETIHEKPSFKHAIHNRCLILADAFFEWQWLDAKGKQKQKFEISLENNELFAFAGLYSEWTNKATGEIMNTYTILTTEANELMAQIHNTKKRMPILVSENDELDWLNGKALIMQNEKLKASLIA